MKNTRSRVAVLAAAIGAAAMILAPAAQAETSQLVATSAADALADAKAGVVKLEAFESVDRAMAAPGKIHNYRFDTTTNFWSVAAVWSPTSGDVDLDLYDDKARKKLLGMSSCRRRDDRLHRDRRHPPPCGRLLPVRPDTQWNRHLLGRVRERLDHAGRGPARRAHDQHRHRHGVRHVLGCRDDLHVHPRSMDEL